MRCARPYALVVMHPTSAIRCSFVVATCLFPTATNLFRETKSVRAHPSILCTTCDPYLAWAKPRGREVRCTRHAYCPMSSPSRLHSPSPLPGAPVVSIFPPLCLWPLHPQQLTVVMISPHNRLCPSTVPPLSGAPFIYFLVFTLSSVHGISTNGDWAPRSQSHWLLTYPVHLQSIPSLPEQHQLFPIVNDAAKSWTSIFHHVLRWKHKQ